MCQESSCVLKTIASFYPQVTKAEIPARGSIMAESIDIDELEAKLDELETELIEVNSNSERLQRSHSELVELQMVLEKAGAFFDEARVEGSSLHEVPNPLSGGGT